MAGKGVLKSRERPVSDRASRNGFVFHESSIAVTSIFASAIDNLFTDPNIARDATYIADVGAPALIRVVIRRADDITSFGDARLWSETTRIDLRVAEVATPRPGDRVEIDGEAFIIQGEPVRDRERLIWTVDLRPA